jgi:hypothetical protein
MKNLKIAQILACLFLLILVNIQQSIAHTHMDIESKTSGSELQYDIHEVMDEFLVENEIETVLVEIVDQDFNLIAFGTENESRIEKLINKSDLLTEITGKKYFRLYYENE